MKQVLLQYVVVMQLKYPDLFYGFEEIVADSGCHAVAANQLSN